MDEEEKARAQRAALQLCLVKQISSSETLDCYGYCCVLSKEVVLVIPSFNISSFYLCKEILGLRIAAMLVNS